MRQLSLARQAAIAGEVIGRYAAASSTARCRGRACGGLLFTDASAPGQPSRARSRLPLASRRARRLLLPLSAGEVGDPSMRSSSSLKQHVRLTVLHESVH